MSRFVRPSKYRHVFGQPAKKEHGIENVKITTSAWDTNLINASGSYLSVNWASSGGGAFAILPLPNPFAPLPHNLPYKLPDIIPLARGHTAPVLDTAWSPFDDSVVVSAGEDGKILVWKVQPDEFDLWGTEHWVPKDFDPVARIAGSVRKVGQVSFHPTANHVFAAASGDHLVKLWDLGNTDDPRSVLTGHTDTIQGLAFNHTGTLLVTTCRDRKIRMFDARAGGEPVRVADGHGGIKGSRVVWMGDKDRIATTGFSKMSDRQISIWDTTTLANVKTTTLDQSSGVVMPFWSDNNILFLAGKGDGNIRYYEYEADALYPLSEHKSSDPQRGIAFLPRRALNVSECEIARAYKIAGTTIEPIAFVVPRKSDSFQSDIFPPAPSSEPALTAGEFFTGKTAQPNLVDLDTGAISSSSAAVSAVPTTITAAATTTQQQPSRTVTAPPPAPSSPVETKSHHRERSETAPTPTALHIPISPSDRPERVPSPNSFRQIGRSPGLGGGPNFSTDEWETPSVAVGGGGHGGHGRKESSDLEEDGQLSVENARLASELRDAKTQIRNLELQVETMKANAQRAARLLDQ